MIGSELVVHKRYVYNIFLAVSQVGGLYKAYQFVLKTIFSKLSELTFVAYVLKKFYLGHTTDNVVFKQKEGKNQ